MAQPSEPLAKMHELVLTFLHRNESAPFRLPVEWKALGLDDYPQIVKKPMDLGTVKKKLESKEYSNIDECAADIRLIWTNCMTYNQDGSDYYQLAETFARKFEEQFSRLREELSMEGPDENRVPALEEKTAFSYDIFKITTEELGRVVSILENKCPSALLRKDAEEEIQINIDSIEPKVFHEVYTFVQTCLPDGGAAAAKKKRMGNGAAAAAGAAKANKRQK